MDTEKGRERDAMERVIKFSRLLHQYHQYAHMNKGPFGDPGRGQGRILAILHMNPEITQKELSFLLDMRPQSMGELLAKLEKKELISRHPSEKDRRVMDVRLTEKGKAAVSQKQQEKTSGAFDILEVLDEEEQQQLSTILDKLIEAMEEKLCADARFKDQHMHNHLFGRRAKFGHGLRPHHVHGDHQHQHIHERSDQGKEEE